MMIMMIVMMMMKRMNESGPAQAHSYTPVGQLGEESLCTPDHCNHHHDCKHNDDDRDDHEHDDDSHDNVPCNLEKRQLIWDPNPKTI